MINLINKILLVLALIVLAFFAWFFTNTNIGNPFGIKSTETTHSILLEEISSMGNLELTSFKFKDIVDHKLTRDFLPDPRALLIVYGEAVGCINLAQIQKEDIVVSQESVLINLPKPILCHYKIDHSKSKIYDSEYAFMNEALLFEEAYKSAELKLREEALNSGILNNTEENAENILKPLIESLTHKTAIIRFKKDE